MDSIKKTTKTHFKLVKIEAKTAIFSGMAGKVFNNTKTLKFSIKSKKAIAKGSQIKRDTPQSLYRIAEKKRQ